MPREDNINVYAWTNAGPVYSSDRLIDVKNVELLKSACRTKHLFLPRAPQWLRSIISAIFGSRNRIDYRVAKASTIPPEFIRQEPWEIEYLYMMAKHARIGILETGRFNGGSTVIEALANTEVPIYSIDYAPQNDDFLVSKLRELEVGANVHLIVGDSQNTRYEHIDRYDLLYIDADHSYKGCLNDLVNWWDQLVIGGHILLHDCYFGCEVQDAAIEFIKGHDVEIVVSPYKSHEHRRYPQGSLCHLVKKCS